MDSDDKQWRLDDKLRLKRSSWCGGSTTSNGGSWWPLLVMGGGKEGVRVWVGICDAILPPQGYWIEDSKKIGARDAREGPKVLMSLGVDFGPMG